jgi:hypothetical protein
MFTLALQTRPLPDGLIAGVLCRRQNRKTIIFPGAGTGAGIF